MWEKKFLYKDFFFGEWEGFVCNLGKMDSLGLRVGSRFLVFIGIKEIGYRVDSSYRIKKFSG